MIAGLFRVFIKVLVAAATAALVLTIVGDFLRQLVPEAQHRALWLTGLFIAIPCLLGILLLAAFAAAKPRLQNLLLVGATIGTLLCLLFVTGVDCTLVPSGDRSGRLRMSCRDIGAPAINQDVKSP